MNKTIYDFTDFNKDKQFMNIQMPVDNTVLANDGLNNYWLSNKDKLRGYFYSKLKGVEAEFKTAMTNPYYSDLFKDYYSNGDVENNKGKFRSFLRMPLGYNALVVQPTKKQLGFELFSQQAYNMKLARQLSQTVVDHILGVTEVGVQTFIEYRDQNWNTEYMCEEWLPNNLQLYLTCRLLKSEHQKEDDNDSNGVARGQHTLQEKIMLDHYKESGIPTPLIVAV